MSLTVFCGKGGVGKTSLSLAFGLCHAVRGRRTVVVTSHPLPELALSISLHGLKEQNPLAAENLFVVHIDPQEELAKRVKEQIPSAMLAKAIMSSRFYQSLVEVAPGIKELAFLARLRHLADRRSRKEAEDNFDLIVWDAPATGHFMQTLKVSRDFDTYMSGPFAIAGREMFQFMTQAGNVCLYPVTTLEEMAVDESIELCAELESRIELSPSGLICNLASPLLSLPDAEYEALRKQMLEDSPDAGDVRFMLDRQAIERTLYARLRSAIRAPIHVVEREPGRTADLELLMSLSAKIGQRLGVD